MPTKIILDVDTGTDDAVALMYAALHPDIELVAATSVNGNRPINETTENTLRTFEHIGKSIPVYRGCEFPMIATLTPDRKPNIPRQTRSPVHGDLLPIGEAKSSAQEQNAVNFLIDYYMGPDGPDTILVPVGPLTNVAMALKKEPRIAERIPRMVIMGGNHMVGNTTASSEFNFWVDPEAAKIALAAGIPQVIVPLDATHQACVSSDDIKKWREIGTPALTAASLFVEQRIDGYSKFQPMKNINSAPVHDALCIAYILDPTVITEMVTCYVEVDDRPGLDDARMVCDVLNRSKKEPNAEVALNADEPKFVRMLTEALSRTA